MKFLMFGAVFLLGVIFGGAFFNAATSRECLSNLRFDGVQENAGSTDFAFLISEFSSLWVRVGREEKSRPLISLIEAASKTSEIYQLDVCLSS